MSAFPRNSPWGEVDYCEQMSEGVFQVSTPSHGGIMVRKDEAGFLSPEAIKSALNEGYYLCYEEDCDASIVIRELLDKKLWQIPDRVTDKEGYENSINESLQRWNPDYYEAWQKRTPVENTDNGEKETDLMSDFRKDIIFRDKDFNILFQIKDGESIKITYAYNGEEVLQKCRFLDETHFYVGSSCYHRDEFAEKMGRSGNKIEPVPNQEPKLDVVIAEPGKQPREAEIPMSLTAIRNIIGGKPRVSKKDNFSVTITGAKGNGTIIACGLNSDYITSLHPYYVYNCKKELTKALEERENNPFTLAERLETGKAKAAAHDTTKKAPDTPRKKTNKTEH